MNELEFVLLNLSRDEAIEVFTRCLRSDQEDNDASESALKKLASALACGSRSAAQRAA